MKIVLYGNGSSGNHGCEAITRSTKKIVNDQIIAFSSNRDEDMKYISDSEIRITNDDRNIKVFSSTYILALFKYKIMGNKYSFIRANNKKMVKKIDNNSIALSVGGDNYCYCKPLELMYLNRTLKNRGVKTVLWGCSVEPDHIDKEMVEDLARYDLITARESITYNALLKAGISKNTKLYPDPAFQLDCIELPLPVGFAEGNTLGINVSPLIMSYEKNKGVTFKNYSALIQHIIDTTDMQIALIPHVVLEHNDDRKPLQELYNKFTETGRVIFIDDHNCMELKGYISRCRMFIGARTHATIAAYSACVPTLVVGYSVKARGIARDLFGGEENMVIPVQSLEHENDLVNAFMYIQKNEENIRKHLQGIMPSYIEKTCLAGDEIKKIIIK